MVLGAGAYDLCMALRLRDKDIRTDTDNLGYASSLILREYTYCKDTASRVSSLGLVPCWALSGSCFGLLFGVIEMRPIHHIDAIRCLAGHQLALGLCGRTCFDVLQILLAEMHLQSSSAAQSWTVHNYIGTAAALPALAGHQAAQAWRQRSCTHALSQGCVFASEENTALCCFWTSATVTLPVRGTARGYKCRSNPEWLLGFYGKPVKMRFWYMGTVLNPLTGPCE